MTNVKKLALAAACAAGVLAGPAPAAAAPPAVTVLPFSRPADVVSTGDRVFISGGRDASQIVVTDAAGTVTGSLDGLPGPTDLQLSNDRRVLFAALPAANAIAAFDTASLQETARYSTGAGACPSTLAITGRYLWFGYGCGQWDSNIGRVDLRRPAVATGLAGQTFFVPPLLAAARLNPGVLLVGEPDPSPSRLLAYDVGTGGTLTLVGPPAGVPNHEFLADIALDPAGATAYTAAGFPYLVQAFAMTDLTQPVRTYDTGPYPAAVELSRNGRRIAAAAQTPTGPHLFVFAVNGSVIAQTDLFGQARYLVSGGLAWAPDGQRLYAVTYNDADPAVRAELHVFTVSAG
ncbi:hypothetical protein [Actinoplanes aureus]|uniref:Uncharacterized protein n=1 Tax=Actinoplanes aureus TaxID=2792083 RepID=A0A931FYG5_9ACTN|nr:hypothetical protein [Actinoplanes aureus]MBG0563742.1 hypothetical protein [Actinoplanes aureus]